LPLAGVLLVAGFLRFWQLDSLPPGLYHDEAYYGLDALALLNGELFPIYHEGWELYAADAHAERPPVPARFPVFFEGNYGREPLHVYLVALSIWLFGPTPWAIRLVPAVAGVVAVWTTYLAATALFAAAKERTGSVGDCRPLMAAFFMATLYPAVTFSRFGIRAMLFVPFETLAVFCFWQGINKTNGRERPPVAWFAAAGFFLGAGLYTYAAARLLPLLFLLFIPYWFWLERPALARYWRAVAVMALAGIVTALPMLVFYARYPYFFFFRTAYVANKGLGAVPGKPWLTWLGNVWRVALGLFWQGEGHLRHNLPGRPYLDPIQFALFLPGVAVSLQRRLRPRGAFLLLWLAVMLLPTLMSGDAPHFGRMTGVAPVVAILMAAGAAMLFGRLRRRWGRGRLVAMGCLLLAVSTFWTGRDYFTGYGRHPQLYDAFYVADWQLGQFAAAQPADAALYLAPPQAEMATIYFALPGEWQRLRSFDAPDGALPLGKPGSPVVYLVRPPAGTALDRLRAHYAGLEPGEWYDDFVPFAVPADSPRLGEAQRAMVLWGDAIQLVAWAEERTDDAIAVALYWQADNELERDYTAFVHVVDGDGRLVAQLDRQPGGYPTSEWRPGELVVDVFRVVLPADLVPGTYTLQTGFYHWPTLERLGEPATLSRLKVED
jgi:4-amino-4-deoxy-L-arabinose transferase-like glycosyltransferase